uniref:Uncharacterized protein n=1 Tax=Buteo japonicus TaxID=224669 RepID=A0A8C0B3E9_9AVES
MCPSKVFQFSMPPQHRRRRETHVLNNWTNYAFREMNIQIQQVSKMALQNRLALDMLLLKEQGVCGMLNLTARECCISINNATTTTEEVWKKMKELSPFPSQCWSRPESFSKQCSQKTGLAAGALELGSPLLNSLGLMG